MRIVQSPLGPIALAADATGALVYLGFQDHEPRARLQARLAQAPDLTDESALFALAERQLEDYFQGRRTTFDLPLAPRGTPFQLRVWEELRRIPYGTVLGTNQLNASATVPGTFAYSPPAGTVLDAGTNTLTVIFTPTDTVD